MKSIGEFLSLVNDFAWPMFLQMLLFATVVLIVTAFVNILLRRKSAALKHRLWALAMLSLIVLPIVGMFVPKVSWSNFFTAPVFTQNPDENFQFPEIEEETFTWYEEESSTIVDRPSEGIAQLPAVEDTFPEPSHAEEAEGVKIPIPLDDKPAFAMPWRAMIAWAWISGVLLKLISLVVSHWKSFSLAASSQQMKSYAYEDTLKNLIAKYNLQKMPKVFTSEQIKIPQTLGYFYSKIILPSECSNWSVDRRRVVLSHEMSHIARGDLLWQLISQLASAVYWPHPFVWFASRQLSLAREIACDDQVLSAGEEPKVYASQLLEVISSLSGCSPTLGNSVAMATVGSVEQRIRSILQPNKARTAVGRWAGRLMLLGSLTLAAVVVISNPVSMPSLSSKVQARQNDLEESENLSPLSVENDSNLDLYGDPLPYGAIARLGSERYRTQGRFRRVRILPDNKTLITSTEVSSSLKVYDLETGKLLRTLNVDSDQESIMPIAFDISKDGKLLAALVYKHSYDAKTKQDVSKSELIIWNTNSWDVRSTFPEIQGNCLAFRPNGVIAIGDAEGHVRVLEIDSRKELTKTTIGTNRIHAIAFASEGDSMAVAAKNEVLLWNWTLAGTPKKLELDPKTAIGAITFSPDGKQCAIGNYKGNAASIWDTTTGRMVTLLRGKGKNYYVEGIAFSSDGNRLFVPSLRERKIEIFDVSTGKQLRVLDTGSLEPKDVAISKNDQFVVVVGHSAAFKVWDLSTNKSLSDQVIANEEAVTKLHYSPDDKSIVSGSYDGTVRVWDSSSGRQLKLFKHDYQITGFASSPNNRHYLSASWDDSLRLWDSNSGKLIYKILGNNHLRDSRRMEVIFSSDGRNFMTFGGAEMLLQTFETATGNKLSEKEIQLKGFANLKPHPDFPTYKYTKAQFSTNGKHLLITAAGELHIIETDSGVAVSVINTEDYLKNVRFLRNNKQFVTIEDRGLDFKDEQERLTSFPLREIIVRFRSFSSPKVIREIRIPGHSPEAAAVSPDGKLIAMQAWDRKFKSRKRWISVWSLETGKEHARIYDKKTQAHAMAFSSDGRRLVAGYRDTTILVWDLQKFRPTKVQASVPKTIRTDEQENSTVVLRDYDSPNQAETSNLVDEKRTKSEVDKQRKLAGSESKEVGYITGQVVLKGKESVKIAGVNVLGDWYLRVTPTPSNGFKRSNKYHFEVTTNNQGIFRFPNVVKSIEGATVQDYYISVEAASSDKKLIGVTKFSSTQKDYSIAVQHATEVRGRVIDDDGNPLSGRIVLASSSKNNRTTSQSNAVTDEDGYFLLKGMLIGEPCRLSVILLGQDPVLRMRMSKTFHFRPNTFAMHDIGYIRLPSKSDVKQTNPTRTKIRADFKEEESVGRRYTQALRFAERMNKHVLIVFSDPINRINGELYENIFSFYPELISSARNYQILLLSTTGLQSAHDAKILAKNLGVKLDQKQRPTLCVVDTKRNVLAKMQVSSILKNGRIDRTELLKFLRRYEIKPADPEKLLTDALEKAKRESKEILVEQVGRNYSQISSLLDKHSEIIDRHFVRIQIDEQRMENAEKVNKRLRLYPNRNWWNPQGYRHSRDRNVLPTLSRLDANGIYHFSSVSSLGDIPFPEDRTQLRHYTRLLQYNRESLMDLQPLRDDLSDHVWARMKLLVQQAEKKN